MTTRRAVSVLRNPDFVRLWAAETISQFGTHWVGAVGRSSPSSRW